MPCGRVDVANYKKMFEWIYMQISLYVNGKSRELQKKYCRLYTLLLRLKVMVRIRSTGF